MIKFNPRNLAITPNYVLQMEMEQFSAPLLLLKRVFGAIPWFSIVHQIYSSSISINGWSSEAYTAYHSPEHGNGSFQDMGYFTKHDLLIPLCKF